MQTPKLQKTLLQGVAIPVSSALLLSGFLLWDCSRLGVFPAEWVGHVSGMVSCTSHQSQPIYEPAKLSHSTCFHHCYFLVMALPFPTNKENLHFNLISTINLSHSFCSNESVTSVMKLFCCL